MAISKEMLNQLAFARTLPTFELRATPMQKAVADACVRNRKEARIQPKSR